MKNWFLALRLKTLTAAISPVILGSSLAYREGAFNLFIFFMILLAALLIQIGTNFANDLYDFLNGADNENRIGPIRLTQSGLISPKKMKNAMWISFILAICVGFYLALIGGWPIVIIGLASIFSGIAYTAGPYPLGYNGFGDLFVFIFFGLIAVPGTYYLYTGEINSLSLHMGIIMGMLSTAILVINNLRDIDTDRISGKNTLAVLLGEKVSKIQYTLFLFIPFIYSIYLWYNHYVASFLLVVFCLPISVKLVIKVFTLDGDELNSVLGSTAKFLFIFTILFSLGLVL
tara:strand:- start:1383 stop:2246 length:864 start_codon:yes stop_codon:yes gene_type:complete